MTYRLRCETVTEELIDPYVELSKTEYEGIGACDPAHMAWKHVENPQGRSVAYHLYEGDALIGRICCQIRDFSFVGQKQRAGYLTDLLIHPGHRGMKTFLQLMKEIRQSSGLDFIYVTPNATSAPLYRSVMKFTRSYELSVFAFPLRTGAILNNRFGLRARSLSRLADLLPRTFLGLARLAFCRRPPGLLLSEERPPDAKIDALIQASASHSWLEGRRDASFHSWRFHRSPFYRNRVSYLYQRGDLVGYVATRSDLYLGYRTLFILDVRFDDRIGARELRYVKLSLLDHALREGADLVLGFFMGENPGIARFCSLPLFKIPTCFLPQRVDMFVEPLAESRQLPDDPARYYITLADLDVF